MDPREFAANYDRIADRWDGPAFDRTNGIRQHERALTRIFHISECDARGLTFAARRGTALDVGFGCSGRIIDLLADHGLTVKGLDLSPEMLRRAKQRHPGATFHQVDVCD